MDSGYAAILGVIIGSLLTFVKDIIQGILKRNSLLTLFECEFNKSLKLIDERLNWLKQYPLRKDIGINSNEIVDVEGENVLLCPDNNIELVLPLWEKYNLELAKVVLSDMYIKHSEIVDLIYSFKRKEFDMINSFKNDNYNEATLMAKACYKELLDYQQELHRQNQILSRKRPLFPCLNIIFYKNK